MKVEVVGRKMVKPQTPTPPHLKSYKISFIDQLISPTYIGIILFYRSKPERITHIQESLSKTLVQFYPLAGRFVDHHRTVDCSDQGVEFINAEVTSHELKDLIFETEAQMLCQYFLPGPIRPGGEPTLVASIQATEFKCGGLALSIRISHKIFDAHSVSTFINVWARNGVSPDFNSPSLLFPCREVPAGNDDSKKALVKNPEVMVKRFIFDKDAITALRSKLSRHRTVSKVQAVSAFISLALIRADRARFGKSRPCFISQPVNMRGRKFPPLPQHSCGNLVLASNTRSITATEVDSIGIQELVDLIGDAVEKSLSDCAEMFFPAKDRYKIINDRFQAMLAKVKGGGEFDMLCFTDFTKFGFYDADLGWGKPARVSVDIMAKEKMVVLLGNQEGDGVEALLHLKPQEMSVIEQDEEMKMYAA